MKSPVRFWVGIEFPQTQNDAEQLLLHIDGSKHHWFSDDRYYGLLLILDDATSEIYYAQLVEEESTRTVMIGVREVIETKACSAPYTAIAAAISSSLARRAKRWIRTGSRKWVEP